MKKQLSIILLILAMAVSSWAQPSGGYNPPHGGSGESGTSVSTASECNAAAYYAIGTLCQDTDDGKLYKGTGAAVEEIASSSGDVTGAGDCAGGACLDGSSDGGTYIRLYDGTSAYISQTAGVRTLTILPSNANAESLVITFGDNNNVVALSSGTGGVVNISGSAATATGNAGTATALAADPANCAAGQIALGVTAAGVAECTATPSGLTSVGATTFTGALTGNASTASALAADPSDCAAGQVATGIAASGALSCTATPSVTTLTGAVTGTASGNIPNTLADAAGDLIQGSADNTWAKLTKGAEGTLLRAGATSNAFTTSTFADTYAKGTFIYAATANTMASLAHPGAANYLLYTNATDTSAWLASSANMISLLGSADYATARTNLGLAIGTNVQAYNANLAAIAGLTLADVSVIEGTGAGATAVVTSGGANRILGSNSGNTALEFKSTLAVDALDLSAGTSSVPMVVGTATASGVTAAGSMYFESDTEILTIGDGATSINLDMAPNVTYTFPAATATLASKGTLTNTKWCSSDGTVINCTEDAPAGSGDITAVGSCSTGSCATIGNADTSGGYIDFLEDSDNGTNYVRLKAPDSTADAIVTLPAATGTLALLSSPALTTPTVATSIAPASADGATLGTAALEFSDLYLATGGVIYGENDQTNNLTSSSTGWATSLDLTVTGGDVTIAAAGVKLTGANGALTILGLGDGADEDVKIDLNTTANTIIISSPASSATTVSLSALNLVTTGTISGLIPTVVYSADGALGVTVAQARAGTFFVNTYAGTQVMTLPAAEAGMAVCLRNGQGNARILQVHSDGTDYLVLPATGDRNTAANHFASAAEKNAQICLVAVDATDWYITSTVGTWAAE